MSEQLVPEVRVAGFDGAWTRSDFGGAVSYLKNNSLSRAQLSSSDTGIKNLHYGDLLVRYGAVLDVAAERMPFVADPSGQRLGERLSEGDVVFADAAEDSTVGKCCELRNLGDDAVVSGLHTIAARPTVEFGPGFLGYSLNSPAFHDQLLSLMQGSKVSSISRSSLNGCTLTYPTKSEQAAIGGVLMSVDQTLRQHEQKHRQLQQAKTSLMQRMFPAPGASEPEIRFDGFNGKWRARRLDDLMVYGGSGGTPDTANQAFYNGDIPFLGIADIRSRILMTTAKRLTQHGLEASQSWLVPPGAVALAMYASVGKVGILGRAMATSQAFYAMVFANDATRDFVYSRLQYADATGEWERFISTGTQRNLNAQKVTGFEILVPEVDEQRAIGAFFSKLDDVIEAEAQYVFKLQQVKSALLQKMFV